MTAEQLHALPPTAFARVSSLCAGMDQHLAIRAVIAGTIPGAVYVDDPQQPHSALVASSHRFHFGGDPQNPRFRAGLAPLFADVLYPQALARGEVAYTLYYPAASSWEETLQESLAGRHLMPVRRRYYERAPAARTGTTPLPAGLALHPVDEALLQQESLANHRQLVEEIQSEGGTLADFLAHRFGTCLLDGETLAGWALSEFDWQDRCEVGIETVAGYRRRGVATATAGALLAAAGERGITRIGWHCAADNEPSVATAQRLGFQFVEEYPALFAFFDEALNLAVNGNRLMGREAYGEALTWYERALTAAGTEPPAWMLWNAACAGARLGKAPAALAYLGQALDLGFDDVERLRTSPHLASLRERPEWPGLLQRLEWPD